MRNLGFFFFSLLLITAILAISVYLPGQATLTVADWKIEMNLLLFVLLSYLAISLIKALVQTPGKLRKYSCEQRDQREKLLLTTGIRRLMEGDWRGAEKLLRKGASLSERPLLYSLGAAEAAFRQQKIVRCQKYLDKARDSEPEAALSVEILRSRMHQSHGKLEEAIRGLQDLQRSYPKNRFIDERLLELKLEQHDWEGVLTQLERLHVPPRDRYELQAQAFEQLLLAAFDPSSPGNHLDAIEELWQRMPAKLRRDPRTIKSYTLGHLRGPRAPSCEPILRKALKRAYDPDLALLYGMAPSPKPELQLRFIEQMLRKNPKEPLLLLAAGLLSARMKLWGKARSYLESSQALSPQAETCRAIATLLENQGDHAAAARNYRKGLELLVAKLEPSSALQCLIPPAKETPAAD